MAAGDLCGVHGANSRRPWHRRSAGHVDQRDPGALHLDHFLAAARARPITSQARTAANPEDRPDGTAEMANPARLAVPRAPLARNRFRGSGGWAGPDGHFFVTVTLTTSEEGEIALGFTYAGHGAAGG